MLYLRSTNLVIILVIIAVMIPAAASVETGGYVVQPAYDIYPEYSDLYFTPRSEDTVLLNDPVPASISLTDLPLWILVILGVAMVTPGIVCLGKYLSAANFPIIGGFRRVSRNNILENSSREMIFQCVKENPGVQVADLKRSTGFTYKNLIYHLNVLANFGVVTSDKCKNSTRYFENSGKFSHKERAMLMHLNHPSDKKIIETVLHHPGISRYEISRHVGISGPSVSWHMHFLLHDQIIEQRKEGTIARHHLPDRMLWVYENVVREISL
ncbi:MAG: winged helix-turn-helix transcriptional regulator [Euryarchaeota archaeon]|nr:winged helix-turn-helix transcriptional regulator [Euryarchaeota archaeon]